jgi:hypothetical protein
MMRTKYKTRDQWLALVVDTSRSIAVRLDPVNAEASERAPPEVANHYE